MGNPKASLVSTSYVQRTNLGIRTNVRRFTRLTNAFSRKTENHAHAVSLHYMAHNFLRAHGTLTTAAKGYKTSPAWRRGSPTTSGPLGPQPHVLQRRRSRRLQQRSFGLSWRASSGVPCVMAKPARWPSSDRRATFAA